jgi:TrmH family RNA methyltransferase
VISSTKNPKVTAAVGLHKRAMRERDRRFLVEGAQGVREALEESPPVLETLFVDDELGELAVRAREKGVEVVHAAPGVLHRLTSTVTPQGIVGVAPFVDVPLEGLPGGGCVTVLHEVRDPGNAGTILRSADASGASGVVFTSSSVDLYNAKTIRASAGSVFHLPVTRGPTTAEAIEGLRSRGFRILAMDPAGEESVYTTEMQPPVAFVFGNEAAGLPDEIVRLADATVRVPHAGRAESLNLAAAATVCLFDWARRSAGASAELETLIAAAAHDIRSPLTAMKGFGYALERRWPEMTDEQRAVMLAGIVHDADRMDQTLRLLVDAARATAGTLEPYPDRIDLSELVNGIAEQQARDPEHPEVRWRGDPGPFFVDGTRVRTAVLAFDEALVWWASDGPIEVASAQEGDHLVVEVARGGPTVSQDEVLDLFQPRRPGTGGGSKIGLFVVRRVAEILGGSTAARVEDGRLVFVLRLPLQ